MKLLQLILLLLFFSPSFLQAQGPLQQILCEITPVGNLFEISLRYNGREFELWRWTKAQRFYQSRPKIDLESLDKKEIFPVDLIQMEYLPKVNRWTHAKRLHSFLKEYALREKNFYLVLLFNFASYQPIKIRVKPNFSKKRPENISPRRQALGEDLFELEKEYEFQCVGIGH